ncbi:hypothetical protein ACLB2K_059078 [Fragaria x ananassa]
MLLPLKKQILFALLGGLSLILLVHAQDEDQSGFVDTGESKLVLRYVKDFYQQPYWGVRSFPEGIRNCYKINVTTGDKYLIRVSFVYGNYDGKGMLPTFLLYLGTNLWDSVKVQNESYAINKELIHVAPRNYIHVCLVNDGSGVPFISAIELRPLNVTSYPTQIGSLALNWRLDIGQTGPDLKYYRYPKDIHDRFWDPYEDVHNKWFTLNTSSTVDFDNHNLYEPASVVMSTAATAKNATDPLMLWWDPPVDANDTEYYVYMHFAELEKLQPNESRWQYITNNGELYMKSFAPRYLYTDTIYNRFPLRGSQNFSIIKAENSTLPPSINGLEIYTLKEFLELETNQDDGLEYLHYGCKPPMIHRDVKSTNILLSEKFQAKLSDFGLSRNFAPGDGTHIVTGVAGTPGYLAPEYHQSNRLNEKSDVYSFGIVLLEIITGRPVYARTNGERTHITRWVELMLPRGDIYSIIDPMLERNFNVNSAWKAVETAMACVSAEPSKRPVMSTVVMELKECLASQLDLTNFNSYETELGSSSIDVSQNNSIIMMRPSVR